MFLEYHQYPLYLQPSIVDKTWKPFISVKKPHYHHIQHVLNIHICTYTQKTVSSNWVPHESNLYNVAFLSPATMAINEDSTTYSYHWRGGIYSDLFPGLICQHVAKLRWLYVSSGKGWRGFSPALWISSTNLSASSSIRLFEVMHNFCWREKYHYTNLQIQLSLPVMQSFQAVIVDFSFSLFQMFGGELQRFPTQYLGYANWTLSVGQFISVHSQSKAMSSFPFSGFVHLMVRTDCYANSLGAAFYPFYQESRRL